MRHGTATDRAVRRFAVGAMAGALLLGAVACGGEDEPTETSDSDAAEATTRDTSSKAKDSKTTKTTEDSTDDTKGTSDTEPKTSKTEPKTSKTEPKTSKTEPRTSATSAEAGEVEDAGEVTWTETATEYNGRNGLQVTYECAEDGTPSSVWGTDTYTDDSSVCTAAVHAGLITVEDGGTVTIEIAPGEDEYVGSEDNGIATSNYASWGGSYTFVED